MNQNIEEQKRVEQAFRTLGDAFRQTEDDRSKRIEDFKQVILSKYPSSAIFVENKENIIHFLFNGYCKEEEKKKFAESQLTKGNRFQTEEEQEIAKTRKTILNKLRRHFVKIHEQLYGFTLESTSEKRMSNGSQRMSNGSPLALESPQTSSENLTADGQNTPTLNPYLNLLPEVIERFGQPVHNPNYEQHQFVLPFNAVVVAPTEGGKTTFVYNFIKRCGDETGPNTFSHIYLCVKMIDQPLYQNLLLQNDCVTHVTLNTIPSLDQFQNRENILFVFDDFVSYAKTKDHKVVEEFFTSGRHLNITSIYITQRFHDTPTIIRENALVVVMLQIELGEARKTLHNYKSFKCNIDGLLAMYNYAVEDDEKSTREGYTNVFIVDRRTKTPQFKKFRKNFREFLNVDDFYPPEVQPAPRRTPYSSAKKAPQVARPVVSPNESTPIRSESSPQTPASNESSLNTGASNVSSPQISAGQFVIEELTGENRIVPMEIHNNLTPQEECMDKLADLLYEAQEILHDTPLVNNIIKLFEEITEYFENGTENYCVPCQDRYREWNSSKCKECKLCSVCLYEFDHNSRCSTHLEGMPDFENISISN